MFFVLLKLPRPRPKVTADFSPVSTLVRLKINRATLFVQKLCNVIGFPCVFGAPFLAHSHHTPLSSRNGHLLPASICNAVNQKGTDVKLIIATIKPFKLEEVREALTTIGVKGMMVTEIKGFGAQSGHTEIYRGAEYAVNFVPKVKLEIVVVDSMADQVVSTIADTAKTDKIGDGKIFTLDVQGAMRVRTGETGDDAV